MCTASLISPAIHKLCNYFHFLAVGNITVESTGGALLSMVISIPLDNCPESFDFAQPLYFKVSEWLSSCFLCSGLDNSQLSRLEAVSHWGVDSHFVLIRNAGRFFTICQSDACLLYRNGSSWRDVLFCFVLSCRISLCVLDINSIANVYLILWVYY